MIEKKMAKYASAAALVAAGLVTGGVLAGSLNANAATGTGSSNNSSSTVAVAPTNPHPGDLSRPQRSDEKLLTGDVAAKVKAAALAKYPGATVQRLETDSDGVYEAHIISGGKALTVQVDKAFTVTGTQMCGPHHGGPMPPAGAPTQAG